MAQVAVIVEIASHHGPVPVMRIVAGFRIFCGLAAEAYRDARGPIDRTPRVCYRC